MRSPGINGERELRGQLGNPGSPGKMAVKTECVYYYYYYIKVIFTHTYSKSSHERADENKML